jgi:hypothetical protein
LEDTWVKVKPTLQVNAYPTISLFDLTTGNCFEAGDRKFFANIVLCFYFLLHLVMMGFEVW